jgi:hypothetical protein
MSSRRFVSPYCTELIYLGLGDKGQALGELEKAYEVRSPFGQVCGIRGGCTKHRSSGVIAIGKR